SECLEGFPQPHVVGQNSAEFELRKMAKKIKPLCLIRSHLGLNTLGEILTGDAPKSFEPLAERLGLGRISKALQPGFVQMRDLFKSNFLGHRREALDSHVRHR